MRAHSLQQECFHLFSILIHKTNIQIKTFSIFRKDQNSSTVDMIAEQVKKVWIILQEKVCGFLETKKTIVFINSNVKGKRQFTIPDAEGCWPWDDKHVTNVYSGRRWENSFGEVNSG